MSGQRGSGARGQGSSRGAVAAPGKEARGQGSWDAAYCVRTILRFSGSLSTLLLLFVLSTAHAAPANQVYLPLVASPPVAQVTLAFGSALGPDGALIGPGNSFPVGTRALAYRAESSQAVGQPYSERWLLNGVPQPALNATGLFPASGVRSGVIGASDGGPLPAGTYRLEVRIGGRLAASADATVSAP